MACNCNIASKTCDPCMFCTPPGVVGLTTCQPPDPCEGYTTDITCVTYNGQDFPCINVTNGDDLITVLLNILATYFPPEVCCELEGELSFYTTTTSTTSTTTTSTTSTTTTSTTSTTTTTTQAPATCQCYPIVNGTYERHSYAYVNCNTKLLEFGIVLPRTESGPPVVVYQCALSITVDPELSLLAPLGECGVVACPPGTTTTTTTTTTTIEPGVLYGRYTTVPSAVIPDADIVVSYFDTNGILVPSQTLPALIAPFDYYLCIQCGTTITIISGEPNGPITYDDLTGVDCKCLL